ncbi:hypothetical protein FKW77_010134 [Venturia effusa]|uniref:Uncharacterized protein n=1 Tax=Venturia effusa TaxID=50376 RepID=A0A517KXJ6_9PEZI|nr:hypothetical protein FKW77_010134 [Venturia effusa]
MSSTSDTTICYSGKHAAMLGWKFDSTRQLWYRTTIFWPWDVSEQGMPTSPPQHLMKGFLPGRRCPQGNLEQLPHRNPKISKITKGRRESSSSDSAPQAAISTVSKSFSGSAHPKASDLHTSKESFMRSRLSLPRFKATTPEGKERDCVVFGDELTRGDLGSAKTTPITRPSSKCETVDAGDIWNFDEWETEAARLANTRNGRKGNDQTLVRFVEPVKEKVSAKEKKIIRIEKRDAEKDEADRLVKKLVASLARN